MVDPQQQVSPELQQFIARESQVAQIQSMIATLTEVSQCEPRGAGNEADVSIWVALR